MEVFKSLLEGIRRMDNILHINVKFEKEHSGDFISIYKETYSFFNSFQESILDKLQNELDYTFIQSNQQGLKNYIDVLLAQANTSREAVYVRIIPSELPNILEHKLPGISKLKNLPFQQYLTAYFELLKSDLEEKIEEEEYDAISLQHIYVCYYAYLTALMSVLEQRLSELPEEIDGLQSVDGPRGKLILLYELGLLDVLMGNYKYLKKADLARLICLVTGITDKKEAGTLSRQMFAVYNDGLTSGKGGKPINDTSVKKIRLALEAINVKVVRLTDSDK